MNALITTASEVIATSLFCSMEILATRTSLENRSVSSLIGWAICSDVLPTGPAPMSSVRFFEIRRVDDLHHLKV